MSFYFSRRYGPNLLVLQDSDRAASSRVLLLEIFDLGLSAQRGKGFSKARDFSSSKPLGFYWHVTCTSVCFNLARPNLFF